MNKPAVLPEIYTGDKSWDEWIDHFDSVATVCEWDDAAKLKWLRVRLTERAGTTFRRLPEATRNDFKEAVKALRKRFEPESRKELYMAELQTRTRKRGEDWASFGEDLKLLADKAYPDLQEEARERFALIQYLSHLENPQIAFSVRQAKPATVNEAVTLTLEMNSYMQATKPSSRVTAVSCETDDYTTEAEPVAAATLQPRDSAMQLILNRMDQLESKLQDVMISKKSSPTQQEGNASTGWSRTRQRTRWRQDCWNCGEDGHLSRDCTMPRKRAQQQGKGKTVGAVSHACNNKSESEPKSIASDDNVPTFSVSYDTNYVLKGLVNGVPANILADTGAAVTVMSKEMWDKAKASDEQLKETIGRKLVGVQGVPLQLRGSAQIDIELQGEKFAAETIVADSLTTDIILGRDFLRDHQCTINMSKGKDTLRFNARGIAITLNGKPSEAEVSCVHVTLDRMLQVPPQSELEVMGQVPCSAINRTWVLEGRKQDRNAVLVARALVKPDKTEVPVRILNIRDEMMTISKGTTIAEMELLPPDATPSIATVEQFSVPQEEALWEMAAKCGDQLSQEEREQLFMLFLEYHDLFAKSSGDFGRTGKIKHTIETGECRPIRQQTRRISPIKKEEAGKLLKEMLHKNVIQPSSSPWASPVVLVQKKDGSTRFCVDYRKVNAITRKDAYPLPRVDDTLDTLSGAQWFSTLDLISGYWQVEMDPTDIEKTAFCTHEGLFEFQVMPFGLCNAPATFQRLMDMVLAGIKWKNCLVYLDDIIVIGKTFREHLANLKEVFQRLREAGLRLKPNKCHFCSPQVEFLGHIVSRDGVHTDPRKTAKVAEWPKPTNKKEVQQFLGLANYYRRFVKDFSSIAKPLHRLTEKTAKFEWTTECQAAFEDLRHRLVTAPVLAFPDYSRPFLLDTDASGTGIGAVLSQVQEDGTERVIAYASRVLTRPERNYCVTRRELLAVVTFVQHFRPYLLGRQFLLRTDHGSLTWLSNFKEPEGQLARWLERLQEYNFNIIHRPGRKHQNADSLSRRPCTQCGRESHEEDPAPEVITVEQMAPILVEKSPEELRQKQLSDGPIRFVLQAIEKGEKPKGEDVRSQGPTAQRLSQLWKKLTVEKGVLWRRYEDVSGTSTWLQLVVPQSLREEILQNLHAGTLGGHLGAEKTLAKVKERFYWPGVQEDVSNWCRTCEACATRKTAPQKGRAPLQTVKAGYPMQVVAVDIMGPLPESQSGNSYVLVAGDYFTKWMEVYAIPNQEAMTVARKLTDEMFCRFSPPDQLHSDQGKQFESELLKEICKLLQIRKTRTTPYHPQCDGLVERFNRTLLSMLATTTKNHPFDWEDQLSKVCFAYNSSVHSSTGYTPFFLMFGRQAKLPIDIVYGTGENSELPASDYAVHLKKGLEEAYCTVREKLSASHEHRKTHYDKRIHGRPFKDGELVWLHSTVVPRGKSRKLHHPWTGPFKVMEQLSECDYRIRGLGRKRKIHVVHFNRLKLCAPGMRFEYDPEVSSDDSEEAPSPITPGRFGADMELVEMDQEANPMDFQEPTEPRYPRRDRQPPNRYATVVTH